MCCYHNVPLFSISSLLGTKDMFVLNHILSMTFTEVQGQYPVQGRNWIGSHYFLTLIYIGLFPFEKENTFFPKGEEYSRNFTKQYGSSFREVVSEFNDEGGKETCFGNNSNVFSTQQPAKKQREEGRTIFIELPLIHTRLCLKIFFAFYSPQEELGGRE